MRDFRDAKTMAQSLKTALAETSVTITHSQSLELIARAFGLDNWNILAAKIEAEKPAAAAEPAPATAGAKTVYCSFCGKAQQEVKRLIAGPEVAICDECVGLCDSILLDRAVANEIEAAQAANPEADLARATAEALRSYSEERLLATQKSFADWLEHIEWSLREAERALARAPGMPWEPDAVAKKRGWLRRGPFGEQTPEQIRAAQATFEQYRVHVKERAALVEQVLRDRRAEAPSAS